MMHALTDSGDTDTTPVADSFTRPADPTAPAAPCLPSAPAGLPVACWVPREVRDGVDETAVAVYAAMAGFARRSAPGDRPVAWVRQDTIANVARVSDRTVRRAVADLVDAGFIRVLPTHPRAASQYELLVHALGQSNGRPTHWDVIPRQLMRAMQTGAVPRGAVVTWLHLDQALGYVGRTRDSVADLAARTGDSRATVRRHVHQLADLGLLQVHVRPGDGWTLTRPGHPALPATPASCEPAATATPDATHLLHYRLGQGVEHDLTAPAQVPATAAEGAETGPLEPVDNSRTALTSVRSPRSPVSAPITTPVTTTPEDQQPLAFLPQDRHLRNARATATSGEPKQKRVGGRQGRAKTGGPGATGGRRRAPVARVEARPDVRAALGALPGQWLSGLARRWRPGIAAAVAVALDGGAPVPAVVRAIVELGDLDAAGGRHVLAVRGALKTLSADLRLGLACTGCGAPLDRPGAPCGPRRAAGEPTSAAVTPTTETATPNRPSTGAPPRRSAHKRLDDKPVPTDPVTLVDDLDDERGQDDEQPVPLAQRLAAYADLGLSPADVRALGDHHGASQMARQAVVAAAGGDPLPSPDRPPTRPAAPVGSPGSPEIGPRARACA